MSVRKILFASAVSVMAIISVFAQTTPRDVSDLVGANAASGESELMRRGYQFVKSTNSNERNYANWWKASTKICLNVVTINGRYDSIAAVISVDCNQAQGGNDGPIWGGGSTSGNVNVSDLVGIRASSGESEMETRGFRNVDRYQSGGRSYTIWWRELSGQCVQVATANGQYDSVTALGSHPKCGRGGNNSGGNSAGQSSVPPNWARGTFYSSNPNVTMTIANNGQVTSVINGQTYYGRYRNGTIVAADSSATVTRTRNGIRTYNSTSGQTIEFTRNSGGGMQESVDVRDLVGKGSTSGAFQLGLRGFNKVDGFKTGSTSYGIWWRSASGQCIQTATANGRYDSITDLNSHPKCR